MEFTTALISSPLRHWFSCTFAGSQSREGADTLFPLLQDHSFFAFTVHRRQCVSSQFPVTHITHWTGMAATGRWMEGEVADGVAGIGRDPGRFRRIKLRHTSSPETAKRKERSFRFAYRCRENLRGHRAGALQPRPADAIEPDAAHARIGAVQVLAEAADHLHADDRVVAEKL